MEITREQLRQILDVTENTLRTIIRRKKLNMRLNQLNYNLIDYYKVGRNSFYILEKKDTDIWLDLQSLYKIKSKEEHLIYSKSRLLNLNKSRNKIIQENNLTISPTTAKVFDDILEEQRIIQKQFSHKIKDIQVKPTNVVYRFLDEQNNLIYIGKSSDLRTRIKNHSMENKQGDWFHKEVFNIEYIQFEQYGDCSLAEIYFVSKLKPKYNKDFTYWDTSLDLDIFNNKKWNRCHIIENTICKYCKGKTYNDFVKER